MANLTGGQALAQSLKKHGVDTIFGLPGIQLDWLFDGLYDLQAAGDLKIYHTRHEQATTYMADGYARTTGKPGIAIMVPGPGLLNGMAGLSTAYACSSPVLSISGQIRSDLIGVGRGELHEIPHQLEMMKSVTKWAQRAMKPEEIPSMVHEAFKQMLNGHIRPVHIEVPPDVLQAKADMELFGMPGIEAVKPDPDQVEKAAEALGKAERPLIYVGGGVLRAEAWKEVQELAEMLEAPVIMSVNGKGVVSSRHHLGHSTLSAPDLTPNSDAVLVVGTRFVQPANSDWGPGKGQTVIQMDIDSEEIGRNHKPDIGIVSDAKLGLTELIERVGKHNRSRESRKEELEALKAQQEDLLFEVQPQASYAQAIREVLPDDGIVVNESTQVGYFSGVGFPVYEPRSFIGSGYQGTLGFGFATALGAQVGNPNKKVVSINGDGGFYYNVQELSTMAKFNINMIAIVFNDGAYGNVKAIQRMRYGGREIASTLENPDFVTLAKAFNIAGRRAETPEQLREALREGFALNEPMLIDYPTAPMPMVRQLSRGRVRG